MDKAGFFSQWLIQRIQLKFVRVDRYTAPRLAPFALLQRQASHPHKPTQIFLVPEKAIKNIVLRNQNMACAIKTRLAHINIVHYSLIMVHNETVQYRMALEFKDRWLELFYEELMLRSSLSGSIKK